jgi:CRISPR-associated protein (TIGR03984 family)
MGKPVLKTGVTSSVEKGFFSRADISDNKGFLTSEKFLKILDGKEAFCFFILDHQQFFGKFSGTGFLLPPETEVKTGFLQSLRIFNSDFEFYLWPCDNGFNYRLRQDYGSGGPVTDLVVACHPLNGTRIIREDDFARTGFTAISERRGIGNILPLELQTCDVNHRIYISTFHYIGYNEENGLAGYIDCRFVDFISDPIKMEAQR